MTRSDTPSPDSAPTAPPSASADERTPSPSLLDPDLWAWGVDISTSRIAIAATRPVPAGAIYRVHSWSADVEASYTATKARGLYPKRMEALANVAHLLTAKIGLASDHTAGAIAIETTHGRSPALRWAVGAAMVGIYRGLKDTWDDNEIPCWTVDNATWKKDVVGHGRADKPEIMKLAHHVLTNQPRNQDEADAALISIWCLRQATHSPEFASPPAS